MDPATPVCLDAVKERLLDRLAAILSLHPAGIKEYALYRILKQENLPLFSSRPLNDELELFKTHFLLFHLLYTLKSRLLEREEGDLEIHCLMIRIKPWPRQGQEGEMATYDPLQGYYLDLENLEKTTRADVGAMLDSFWQRLAWDERRGEAFKLLELPKDADPASIRQRYRQLAKKHHPDAGGDGAVFLKIAQAAEILLKPFF
ncbi:MAG: heat shock protein DnaJ domain protein [Magnetococcales bacterium]|nr:heat shock protein DnaJ domain protein [Magnetococcales bacterium]HIJ85155.1 DnaJ domain-containing protein [Magnetococcales bacterium]